MWPLLIFYKFTTSKSYEVFDFILIKIEHGNTDGQCPMKNVKKIFEINFST